MDEPLLEMHEITKYIYDSSGRPIRNSDVKILDSVSFDLRRGEVHVLVGENGAGKSTLMKILGGIIPPDQGTITLEGAAVSFASARKARDRGIAFIHQELNLCANLDVAHNIFLGREPTRGGVMDKKKLYAQARALLSSLGFEIDPMVMLGRLTTAHQQIVEIAKALSYESKILIMDEPTASLSKNEIDRLFSLMRTLQARGIGIVYISHRFEELRQVGNRISVLRDGRSIGTIPSQGFREDQVIQMMVGRSIDDMYPRSHRPTDDVLLAVENLKLLPGTPPLSLTVRRGEVVGISGLVGSGRTKLLKTIFGARRLLSGRIVYSGKKINGWRPGRLVRAGMAYLPEDRKTEGLITAMTIRENVTLASLFRLFRFGVISLRKESEAARKRIQQLRIVARSVEQMVGTLSGGNQQRTVFAKWRATEPQLLLLDEPTRGIDVGAKSQIYKMIDEIAAQGLGVLMVSSELPELIGMSDRIYVMRAGTLVAELTEREAMTQAVILAHILKGASQPVL
jgi:ABC-type sugar transport system ATPase subunit